MFFFQAEDGIRDLVRSRGLGDVYKRQAEGHGQVARVVQHGRAVGLVARREGVDEELTAHPVSYTHLTLPTSDLV